MAVPEWQPEEAQFSPSAGEPVRPAGAPDVLEMAVFLAESISTNPITRARLTSVIVFFIRVCL